MQTVAAGVFKAKCLALMDEVNLKRESVLITKNGKPVARLVPVENEKISSLIGFLRGEVEILGEVDEPIIPPEDWKRLR